MPRKTTNLPPLPAAPSLSENAAADREEKIHPYALAARRLLADQVVSQFLLDLEAQFTAVALTGQDPMQREIHRLQLLALVGMRDLLQSVAKGQIPSALADSRLRDAQPAGVA